MLAEDPTVFSPVVTVVHDTEETMVEAHSRGSENRFLINRNAGDAYRSFNIAVRGLPEDLTDLVSRRS